MKNAIPTTVGGPSTNHGARKENQRRASGNRSPLLQQQRKREARPGIDSSGETSQATARDACFDHTNQRTEASHQPSGLCCVRTPRARSIRQDNPGKPWASSRGSSSGVVLPAIGSSY
mmetsp:Transcript_37932/g.79290  ORF Transcript_37932/g.79290 Transcript_37932/m.79290 type:complete len:118 (+) Transcript_37932:602-955(+)